MMVDWSFSDWCPKGGGDHASTRPSTSRRVSFEDELSSDAWTRNFHNFTAPPPPKEAAAVSHNSVTFASNFEAMSRKTPPPSPRSVGAAGDWQGSNPLERGFSCSLSDMTDAAATARADAATAAIRADAAVMGISILHYIGAHPPMRLTASHEWNPLDGIGRHWSETEKEREELPPIGQLDLDPASSGPCHQHRDHLRITVAKPLEGGKLGILVNDLVVASIFDPRALDDGWCLGDLIIQVNGQPVYSMFEFAGALSTAMASYQVTGNPLSFKVCRHPDLKAPFNPGSRTAAAVAVPATAIATLPTTTLAAPSGPLVVRSASPPATVRPVHHHIGCRVRSESPLPRRSPVYSQLSEASTGSASIIILPATAPPAPLTSKPLLQGRVFSSTSLSPLGSGGSWQTGVQSATPPLASTSPLAVQSATLPLASTLPLLVQALASQQAIVPQATSIPVQQQQQLSPAQKLRMFGGSGSVVLPASAAEFPLPKVWPKATAKCRIY